MRPVARIAQSVEQGIENPRVLGSIPSPGTIFREPAQKAGFSLSEVRTLHRTAFDYSAKGLTLRASAKALFNAAQAPVVRVRSPYSEEPAYGGFFAFWSTDSPSNCVRLFVRYAMR